MPKATTDTACLTQALNAFGRRAFRRALTPDETTVLQALHTIDPEIERIASVGTNARRSAKGTRGGLAMMVQGQRIPIGSMGDGIWRLLGIALPNWRIGLRIYSEEQAQR